MRNLTQDTITQAVMAALAGTPDARMRQVMTRLVQHLHGFAREVQLTEQELSQAIGFLTRVGHACDDKRQEFILLSDTLGLSMLTVAMNHDKPAGCTEATVFGPFYVEGSPQFALGDDLANGAAGVPCTVRGTVRGVDGQPLAGAGLRVWQADAQGRYHFRSILAEAYPIPVDGPVGDLLRATGRHPWRPAHLHFMVSAPGHQTLVTHVFRAGDPYLDSDAVFGVRQSLVADWVEQPDGTYLVEYDFVLAPERSAQWDGATPLRSPAHG